jgi:hypothetical protein
MTSNNTYPKIVGVWAVFMLLLILSSNSLYILEHEKVHSEIYRLYEINSTVTYTYFLWFPIAGATQSVETMVTPEEFHDLAMLHAQTELVGYQINAFTNIFVLVSGVIMLLITTLYYKYQHEK